MTTVTVTRQFNMIADSTQFCKKFRELFVLFYCCMIDPYLFVTGKIKGHDLPFDIALLMELMTWFKQKYFSWVDAPECEVCGSCTVHAGNSSVVTGSETCRLEVRRGRATTMAHQIPISLGSLGLRL